MENTNTILEELRGISPLVAGIGRQNPYTVPPSYFDGLGLQLMLRIALEEKAGTDPSLNINKDNVYEAPEHYFESLAGDIIKRIKAQETGSAKEELDMLSPLLGQIERKNPFSSPEGYFNEFSDNMVSGVKALQFVNEELENLSPLMVGLKNKAVYEVPDGYFDTIPAIILKKAKQQQPARLFSIGAGRKIMRYAAAAVVAGIIVFSVYQYSGNTKTLNGEPAPEISKLSDQEIENFLNNNAIMLADIGAETDTVNTAAEADAGANTDDAKDLLADISDEELQQYMDQRPTTPVSN